MKPIILTLICASVFFTMDAQVLEPCTGDVEKQNIRESDLKYFMLQGLDLNLYNWSDNDANCHFNQMIHFHHSAKNNAIWGGVTLGLGGLMIPISIMEIDWVAQVGLDSAGVKTASIIFSMNAAFIAGGIILVKNSIHRSREMSFHRNEVAKYFRKNSLFDQGK